MNKRRSNLRKVKKPKEKLSVNLPTCRATPTQAVKIEKLIQEAGFTRSSDFWRRCLVTYIEQREANQALKWPLEFAQIEAPRPERSRRITKGLKSN